MRRWTRNRSAARISNRASLASVMQEITEPVLSVNDQIVAAGKALAALNPNSSALKAAREWWGRGQISSYSNEDLDVLSAMTSEIYKLQNARNAG